MAAERLGDQRGNMTDGRTGLISECPAGGSGGLHEVMQDIDDPFASAC